MKHTSLFQTSNLRVQNFRFLQKFLRLNFGCKRTIVCTLSVFFIVLLSCKTTIDVQTGVFDFETQQVKTIKIGNQEWFAANLNVDRFANGDEIFHAKSVAEWVKAGDEATPAWCYYNNDESVGAIHGKLYNWHAVTDSRGLAPEGWEIPSDSDWNKFIASIGNVNNAGLRLKATQGWMADGNGNNLSGFEALPSGGRYNDGTFSSFGVSAFFWTSTDHLMFYGKYVELRHNGKAVGVKNIDKGYGFSVRVSRKLEVQ